MNKILLSLCLLFPALDYAGDQQSGTDTQNEINTAKAAIKDFAGALQAELKNAMQSGGPVTAIAVCNTQAMLITQEISTQKGLHLARVSPKNRNPANAPNEWQAAVLNDFEKQKTEGKDPASLSWSDTVDVDGQREFRFMKAIPTGDICLQCHGTNISADVSKVLTSLYPEDRATGFSEGDIRGAFVVTRRLTD